VNLTVYLLSTYVLTLLLMAYSSRGPDEMIVNSLIVWTLPALLAVALRSNTGYRPYLWPTILLVAMNYFMILGGSPA